ncbi:hypothetical protein ACTXT7_008124 [Hymenolepis weldensis]
MIYYVEVGKDTWVRHHNQLRRRMAESTTDKQYIMTKKTGNNGRTICIWRQRNNQSKTAAPRLIDQ